MRRRRSASVATVIIAVLTLAVAVSMAGCADTATAPRAENVPSDAAVVSASRVFEGSFFQFRYNTGYLTPQRLVIRTAEQWSQAWAQITQNLLPRPSAPTVDFAHEMVILVAMGQRPSGGYSITVDGVYDVGGRIVAEVRESSPGASCITTAALTQPVDAVRVPRRDGAVTFVERAETYDCR
jgi:PrcB C-terminal